MKIENLYGNNDGNREWVETSRAHLWHQQTFHKPPLPFFFFIKGGLRLSGPTFHHFSSTISIQSLHAEQILQPIPHRDLANRQLRSKIPQQSRALHFSRRRELCAVDILSFWLSLAVVADLQFFFFSTPTHLHWHGCFTNRVHCLAA